MRKGYLLSAFALAGLLVAAPFIDGVMDFGRDASIFLGVKKIKPTARQRHLASLDLKLFEQEVMDDLLESGKLPPLLHDLFPTKPRDGWGGGLDELGISLSTQAYGVGTKRRADKPNIESEVANHGIFKDEPPLAPEATEAIDPLTRVRVGLHELGHSIDMATGVSAGIVEKITPAQKAALDKKNMYEPVCDALGERVVEGAAILYVLSNFDDQETIARYVQEAMAHRDLVPQTDHFVGDVILAACQSFQKNPVKNMSFVQAVRLAGSIVDNRRQAFLDSVPSIVAAYREIRGAKNTDDVSGDSSAPARSLQQEIVRRAVQARAFLAAKKPS